MSKERKLRNRNVWRKGAVWFAGMMIVMAAGCQKNPDSSIVKNKDMDKLIEEAQNGSGNSQADVADIAKNYDTYQTTLNDATLQITVNVDAKVDIPQTQQMSVLRVKQKDISQEFLDKANALLMQGETLYDGHVLSVRTRSQVEKEISATIQYGKELAGQYEGNDLKIYQEENQRAIDRLQKEYESAPQSINWEAYLSDGTLKKTASLDKDEYSWERDMNPNGEIYYGVSNAQNGNYLSLYAQNNENYGNCLRYRLSKHGYIRINSVAVGNTNMDNILPDVWKADTTKEALAEAKNHGYEYAGEYEDEAATGTLDEAKKKADELIQNMGLTDFSFYRGDLYCEFQDFSAGGDELADDGMRYSKIYILQYMRQIDGAFVTNAGESKHTEGWDNKTYVKKDWPIEGIEIRVNDEGIIGFDYNAPVEITETVVEKSGMKSFDEVKGIFEKMVLITNARAEEKVTISVDRVVLGYARISEADSFDTGLLVPVWDFMGTITNETYAGQEEYRSVLTINAVDGSIIDRSLGY